jgi:TonB family protein
MRDAVAVAISARQRVNGGFLRSLVVSGVCHAAVLATGLLLLKPAQTIRVMWDIRVPSGSFLPAGSGLPRSPGATAEIGQQRLLKPPAVQRTQTVANGPPARATHAAVVPTALEAGAGAGSVSQDGGLQMLEGPPSGDWYLATIQSRVWAFWAASVHPGVQAPAVIEFTISRDGSVEGIRVVESSGDTTYDQAARRALDLAAPFPPLPKHYLSERCTIRGVFRPN